MQIHTLQWCLDHLSASQNEVLGSINRYAGVHATYVGFVAILVPRLYIVKTRPPSKSAAAPTATGITTVVVVSVDSSDVADGPPGEVNGVGGEVGAKVPPEAVVYSSVIATGK